MIPAGWALRNEEIPARFAVKINEIPVTWAVMIEEIPSNMVCKECGYLLIRIEEN